VVVGVFVGEFFCVVVGVFVGLFFVWLWVCARACVCNVMFTCMQNKQNKHLWVCFVCACVCV